MILNPNLSGRIGDFDASHNVGRYPATQGSKKETIKPRVFFNSIFLTLTRDIIIFNENSIVRIPLMLEVKQNILMSLSLTMPILMIFNLCSNIHNS